MTQEQASQLAEVFRLLGEPNRLQLVAGCLERPMPVGELASRAGIGQTLASHHLRLLRAARLLVASRRGKQVFYAIPDCHVRDMLTAMIEHMAEPHEPDEDT